MANKPIVLYSHVTGPNPWKVAIILEELGIAYDTKFLELSEVKKPPFEALNPNGRVPVIEDPNTGFVLWESGAIIEYLMDTYDTQHKLSYGDKKPEKYLLQQWLMFQMSGQGPYFGQKAWFTKFHSEQLPSAKARYENEIKRVLKVIDSHLAKTGTGYLVGPKVTYADLSFVPWNNMINGFLLTEDEKVSEFMASVPHYKKWHDMLVARPAVAKVLADKSKASAK